MAEGKRNIWLRITKIAAWTIGALIALIAIILCLTAWILTPARLTAIVRDTAAEYIDGDISLGKVELTVWSTFPHARVDIDSLTIRTQTLAPFSHQIPGYTDTLLTLRHMHGGIDLARLALGHIHLTNVEIRALGVNAFAIDSARTNFDILRIPTDTISDQPATSSLPDISIERFAILDSRPIRYISLADTISASLILASTSLTDAGLPAYRLDTGLKAGVDLPPDLSLTDITLSTDGRITWQSDTPYALSLDNFTVGINDLPFTLSTALDFADTLRVDRFTLEMPTAKATDILHAIPSSLLPTLPEIKSDLTVALKATLAEPYAPARDTIPTLDLDLDIPGGHINYGNEFFIDNIALQLTAHIDGTRLDQSTVSVSRFDFRRLGTAFTLTANATRLLSDPRIDGTFDGTVDFDRLPPRLIGIIPGDIHGRLTADSDFALRLSDLTPEHFHRARLTGKVALSNFRYSLIDSVETRLYTRDATLRLGTADAFTSRDNQHRVDSLLTLSVKFDTLALLYDNMNFELSNLRAGIGCLNTADSRDTTQVNPIGGSFHFDRFRFTAPDSTRLRLRDISARATLRRYQGDRKLPEILANITAKRIRYIDRLNRVSLTDGTFDLSANIKPRQQRSAADSAAIAARRRRTRQQRWQTAGTESVTMDLDSTTRRLIRRLNLHGNITAKRGRLFTPYFPLRNSIADLNMDFSTDSLTFRRVRYRAGESDFTLSGKVTGISRFLTSRSGTSPLRIRFHSHSDKIDVNQLSYAVFAGAAFAEKEAATAVDLSTIDDDDNLDATLMATAADTVTAIVVPFNIDAEMTLRADTIIYTDIALRQFAGSLLMRNGAINLSNLSALTDFGSASLTALYSAPQKDNIRFGFGMQLDKVDLKEAIGLIPSVDSLMPLIRNFAGIVNADVAATTDIDSAMNFIMPSLNAAIKLEGDSLVLLDPDTFKSVSKWLLFKKKDRNIIDHMGVELLVANSTLQLFPFMFDIDRYRIGVMGYNDLALNLNYHVSVLKSPLPFKFGINITGNTDDMKIRVGKARYNEKSAAQSIAIVDTTRVNLLKQIENVFRRGANSARLGNLNVNHRRQDLTPTDADTISRADSLRLISAGILSPTQ